jgi:glycosyltransferase involved in cell wall biosynthesis
MSTSISVIVPIFNVEKYLPRCLNSLFKQDIREHIEVILVNDGSTDESPAICADYCQRYPSTILLNQENQGLSEARNAGIKVASGSWLFFLDADDWLVRAALSTLLSFAINQSCDMTIGSFYYAYSSYLLYDDRWFPQKDSFVLSREEAMKQLILQQYFKNFAWGKLYRTEIVKKHLFKPGVFFEDVYWQHLIVDEAKTVGVVPTPLYYYRQRQDSISSAFSLRNLDLLRGSEVRLEFIKEHYESLSPLAEQKFFSLVQNCLDIAKGSNNKELIEAYLSFASRYQINHKPWIRNKLAAIRSRLFDKKPTIIQIDTNEELC